MTKRRIVTSPTLAESQQLEIASLHNTIDALRVGIAHLQAQLDTSDYALYLMTTREDWIAQGYDPEAYDRLCIRVWKNQPDMQTIDWDAPLDSADIDFIQQMLSDEEFSQKALSSE